MIDHGIVAREVTTGRYLASDLSGGKRWVEGLPGARVFPVALCGGRYHLWPVFDGPPADPVFHEGMEIPPPYQYGVVKAEFLEVWTR